MKNPETPVIIVDSENLQPMTWDGDQLVYVTPISLRSIAKNGNAVKTYKRCDAIELIKASKKYAKENNFSQIDYLLMLVIHGKC
jgi:hypothetical protein